MLRIRRQVEANEGNWALKAEKPVGKGPLPPVSNSEVPEPHAAPGQVVVRVADSAFAISISPAYHASESTGRTSRSSLSDLVRAGPAVRTWRWFTSESLFIYRLWWCAQREMKYTFHLSHSVGHWLGRALGA